MNTPICDFIDRYTKINPIRLHMPGHKGVALTGTEPYDITEIDGADVLYRSEGIIRESEKNASELFGTARTVYSAEGSSLSIRAMLYLTLLYAKKTGRAPVIAAGRNAHKSFMCAAAMLDLSVEWLYQDDGGVISCNIDPMELEKKLVLMDRLPSAVYITSPDYLGHISDVAGVARVCHKHGVLLLVDNAHGAYLNFLESSLHPMALGADMCADSAHKTLPVLTGGAYLHISQNAPAMFSEECERAMAMFASTSPSYLILRSLDAANAYMDDDWRRRLSECADNVWRLSKSLVEMGYDIEYNEPLKLNIKPKSVGYTGDRLAKCLLERGIVCEFSDPDNCVMMFTPELCEGVYSSVLNAFSKIAVRTPIKTLPPPAPIAAKAMSIREAMLVPSEIVSVKDSAGRVLADANVSCPPAIPILACGERICEKSAALFEYYGIDKVRVVKT